MKPKRPKPTPEIIEETFACWKAQRQFEQEQKRPESQNGQQQHEHHENQTPPRRCH
jgi:hypothetical protein